MADAPYVFVKNRPGQTYKQSIRIVRYWKHKETGNIVEVRRVLNDVDRNQLRIVIFDPTIGRELNMPFKKGGAEHPFQPPGAPEVKMEPGFEDHYEPYGNFTSRA
jgi:hypothetical protein